MPDESPSWSPVFYKLLSEKSEAQRQAAMKSQLDELSFRVRSQCFKFVGDKRREIDLESRRDPGLSTGVFEGDKDTTPSKDKKREIDLESRQHPGFSTGAFEEGDKDSTPSKDYKSFSQCLYDTDAFKDPLKSDAIVMKRMERDEQTTKSVLPVLNSTAGRCGESEAVKRVNEYLQSLPRLDYLSPAIIRGLSESKRNSSTRACAEARFLLLLGRTTPFSPLNDTPTIPTSEAEATRPEDLRSVLHVLSTPRLLLRSFVQERIQPRDRSRYSTSFPRNVSASDRPTVIYRTTSLPPSEMIESFRQLSTLEKEDVWPILGCLKDAMSDTFAFPEGRKIRTQPLLNLKPLPYKDDDNFNAYNTALGHTPDPGYTVSLGPREAAHIHCIVLAALASRLPIVPADALVPAWKEFVDLRKAGLSVPYKPRGKPRPSVFTSVLELREVYDDPRSYDVVKSLACSVASRIRYFHSQDAAAYVATIIDWITQDSPSRDDINFAKALGQHGEAQYFDGGSSPSQEGAPSLAHIILEWVRTVVRIEWDQTPVLLKWGPVAGALGFLKILR